MKVRHFYGNTLGSEKDYYQLVELENTIWNGKNTPIIIKYDSTEEYAESLSHRKVAVAVEGDTVLGAIDAFNMYQGLNTTLYTLTIGMLSLRLHREEASVLLCFSGLSIMLKRKSIKKCL